MGREAAIGAVAPWLHQIRCPHIPKTGGRLFLGWLCSPDTPRQPFWLHRGVSPHPRLGLVFLPRRHPHPPVPAPTLPPASGLPLPPALCHLIHLLAATAAAATASPPPVPGPP